MKLKRWKMMLNKVERKTDTSIIIENNEEKGSNTELRRGILASPTSSSEAFMRDHFGNLSCGFPETKFDWVWLCNSVKKEAPTIQAMDTLVKELCVMVRERDESYNHRSLAGCFNTKFAHITKISAWVTFPLNCYS